MELKEINKELKGRFMSIEQQVSEFIFEEKRKDDDDKENTR